jgi:hypothetical protein
VAPSQAKLTRLGKEYFRSLKLLLSVSHTLGTVGLMRELSRTSTSLYQTLSSDYSVCIFLVTLTVLRTRCDTSTSISSTSTIFGA